MSNQSLHFLQQRSLSELFTRTPTLYGFGADITLKIWGQCVVSKLSICSDDDDDDDDDDDVKVGDDALILQTVCPNECSCSLSYSSLLHTDTG